MLPRGRFRILFLYDVSESIDVKKLRSLLGERGGSAGQTFPRRTPEYVRFEEPPVLEPADSIEVSPGLVAACRLKYYSFGAVAIEVDVPFEADWNCLVDQASRWMEAPDIEARVRSLVQDRLVQVREAVLRPTRDWLVESYLVTEIHECCLEGATLQPSADELVASHGAELVQLIRGENVPLAHSSKDEALQQSISYYPSDLVVIGAHGAVIYDRPEDASAATQVLEYAKMQLLEFRYYDQFMTGVLSEFYTYMERKRNVLGRWSLPRQAQRFNTIRLDVMDLTERIDNAIKFFSDIYYARIYRLAETRMGVPDYRNLVEQKLRTVGELYDFLVDQFNEARSFLLEAAIVLFCLLDVVFLFMAR